MVGGLGLNSPYILLTPLAQASYLQIQSDTWWQVVYLCSSKTLECIAIWIQRCQLVLHIQNYVKNSPFSFSIFIIIFSAVGLFHHSTIFWSSILIYCFPVFHFKWLCEFRSSVYFLPFFLFCKVHLNITCTLVWNLCYIKFK